MIGTPETRTIAEAVEMIEPILAGRKPEIQGAILADLLAMWLAGHYVADDAVATRTMRAEMLAGHLLGVEELVTINAKMLGVP